MKALLIATLLMSSAFAEEKKEEILSDVKSRIASNVDQKISALQAHKSCVEGASSKDALKACRSSHKEAMKKIHQENKGEREEFKSKIKSMKEERKKK